MKKISTHRPLVVGTLLGSQGLSPQVNRAKKAPVDLIELRLDTFSSLYSGDSIAFSKNLIRSIKKKTRIPLLLTLRSYREQGKSVPKRKRWTDQKRLELIKSLLPLVKWVDVEIRNTKLARALTRSGKSRGVGVIHSFHNFSSSGSWPQIRKWAKASQRLKGDIFKLAVITKSKSQLYALLKNGNDLPNSQKVLIGMGQAGLMSRFIGYSFGSLLTFGHLGQARLPDGQAGAPGQIPVRLLAKSIRDIYA